MSDFIVVLCSPSVDSSFEDDEGKRAATALMVNLYGVVLHLLLCMLLMALPSVCFRVVTAQFRSVADSAIDDEFEDEKAGVVSKRRGIEWHDGDVVILIANLVC